MAQIPKKAEKKREPVEENLPDDGVLLSWEAPRYIVYTKNIQWYSAIIIGTVALVALAFLLEHFTLLLVSPWLASAVIIVGAVVMLTRGIIPPEQIEYAVGKEGFVIGKETLPFSDFVAFSLENTSAHDIIHLHSKRVFRLPVTLILQNVNTKDMLEVMSEILPQEIKSNSIFDKITHFIRF